MNCKQVTCIGLGLGTVTAHGLHVMYKQATFLPPALVLWGKAHHNSDATKFAWRNFLYLKNVNVTSDTPSVGLELL